MSAPRFVKMFSVTGRRFYKRGESPRTERPNPSIDERVNEWVKETGNVIISATPTRHTVMEKGGDGTIIRKTTQMVTVIYQSEADFLQTETEMRRQALVPSPRVEEQTDRQPVSDEEEHRERDLMAEMQNTDSDAGGPEGMDQLLPADSEDDDF